MKELKIGELAKILGVTPDFLKHYENYDIIKPNVSENGYRYYQFSDAAVIMECLKLKWWGYSIKDMKELLSSKDVHEYLDNMEVFADKKKKQVDLIEMMCYDHHCNRDRFEKELNQWYIRSAWPSMYLPHTKNREIIDNEELQTNVLKWISYLPMTHEAAVCKISDGCLEHDVYWGFFAPNEVFEGLDLELCGYEQHVLEQRFFEMNVKIEYDSGESESALSSLFQNTLNLMKEHRLVPAGYGLYNIHFDITDGIHHEQYGIVRVPIEG